MVGGAKGFYTLGVLKEIEGLAGAPLGERFHLIFGTSTGAIIAALLGLGRNVDDVHKLYREHVPTIMRRRLPSGKTAALRHLTHEVFRRRGFQRVQDQRWHCGHSMGIRETDHF